MLTPTGSNGHTQFGSVPDLKLLGAMSLAESPISPSDSISLHEEKIADTEVVVEFLLMICRIWDKFIYMSMYLVSIYVQLTGYEFILE